MTRVAAALDQERIGLSKVSVPADGIRAAASGRFGTPAPETRHQATGVSRQMKGRAPMRGIASHFQKPRGVSPEAWRIKQKRARRIYRELGLQLRAPNNLRRVHEESVTAVVQLLNQTSASIKLPNAMPRRTIDQSPTSRPKNRRAVIAKGALLFSGPNLLKAIGIVFCASIVFIPSSAQIAGTCCEGEGTFSSRKCD